jgi:MFS family permease
MEKYRNTKLMIRIDALARGSKIFHGYWIIVSCFLLLAVYAASGLYGFSLFVKPLAASYGWSRGEVMLGITIYFLVQAAAMPFIGNLIDRFNIKKIIFAGSLLTTAGFILLSRLDHLWQFYAAWAIIGIGSAGNGQIPASALILNWFSKGRGIAIGIMSAGIGAGGLVFSPLIGGYVIPTFGWDSGFMILVLANVIPMLLVLFIIKNKPSDMGLYPDGIAYSEARDTGTEATPTIKRFTLNSALVTSAFWLTAISYFLSMASQNGVIQNQVAYLDDIGFPILLAAGALGSLGLSSAIGKLSFGWLCDRIKANFVCCIGLVFQAISIIILISIQVESPLELIWLYAIFMGLGIGSWLPTLSMITISNFGPASYGAIFGALSSIQLAGAAIGPLFSGMMFDSMNNYNQAFIILALLYVISISAVMLIKKPGDMK